MTAIRTLIATSLLSTLPIGAVFAQTVQSSTEDRVRSTEKAPDTTAVGQTKPPSRDASPTSVRPIERRRPDQVANDAIVAKVCVRCAPEPIAGDPLSLRIRSSVSPERHGGPLDERIGQREGDLNAGAPKQQSDLDTFALASAHRERAETVQEKTNGLWQSWLVSVCDGCGDRKSARALKMQDWPNRDGAAVTGSIGHTPQPAAAHRGAKPAAPRLLGSLEADLTPENVGSIRRMPRP